MREDEIFLAALEISEPSARSAFLDAASGGDLSLRARVEGLLRSHEGAGSFLRLPAVARPDPSQEATLGQDAEGAAGHHPDLEPMLAFFSPSARAGSLGRLGHYEVLEVLGRGGFGIVLRALDDILDRVVAVKVLSPELAATSPARKRFLREARSSAGVRHGNVVQVHAVEEQPLPHLVMEYIPGETIQRRIDRIGPLDTPEILEIGRQVAEGLAAAHEKGLIHRDVKPENILIEPGLQPIAKLTDFGLARTVDDASVTQSGVVIGTPMYMSPEQALGKPVDARSDLFSLGGVLYAMCTGRPPFRANGTLAVLKRVAEDTPRPIPEIIPEVPDWLCQLIARLHAKCPADRYQSAREVADLLASRQAETRAPAAKPAVAVADPGPPGPAPIAPKRRRQTARWAIAAAILAFLSGLGFAEARGVTDLHGTVIRLFFPEGTLVVEADDPGVRIEVDGEDLVITGAGVREIRLRAGSHSVRASKDGVVLQQELITVTANGRQLLRVRREGVPGSPRPAGSADPRATGVEVIGEGPVRQMADRLVERNPAFRGVVRLESANRLVIEGADLRDISPVRAMENVNNLILFCPQISDLAPLRGMDLTDLEIGTAWISDLGPLEGMKLNHLAVVGNPVKDLRPIRGSPLSDLQIAFTGVTDLSPLKGMGLRILNCHGCRRLDDLSPLKGMPIEHLNISETTVTDLSPLVGMRLRYIDYRDTPVADISTLKKMPLEEVLCDFRADRDEAVLRSIPTLKTINGKPAAGFWAEADSAGADTVAGPR
jgi:hypothetical protein